MALQWWQVLGGIVTLLGLSPAPWIGALLTRRLMPLGAHLERVADLKAAHSTEMQNLKDAHARELLSCAADLDRVQLDRANERAATKLERDRADLAASKLAALTEQFGQVTVGLLTGHDSGRKGRANDA